MGSDSVTMWIRRLDRALDNLQCRCSVAERDSGHLVDCGRPDVDEAFEALLSALRAPAEPVSREGEIERLMDGMELAWGVIANAYGGDWSLAHADWRGAAERWRDQHWHDAIVALRTPSSSAALSTGDAEDDDDKPTDFEGACLAPDMTPHSPFRVCIRHADHEGEHDFGTQGESE